MKEQTMNILKRLLKDEPRITDKRRLYLAFLRGAADAAEHTPYPPLHPDLVCVYRDGV